MQRPRIVLVVAVAENGVIGQGGKLPWRLKSEMRHFRDVTWGKPVVVGRKTYESFARKPLPGRTNIVVTRDRALKIPGALVTSSVDAALDAARGDALRRGVGDISVVGGADIYAQTIANADRLVVTRVKLRPGGDTTFPPIDPTVWREIGRTDHAAGPDDEAGYSIHVYERQPTEIARNH
ncbi:MAG: dihydrofolate reductase [Xanthobacteraceae bacterium]|nr:dihydrofolate reductase [Xanthobacteraceae bacterium]